MLESRRPTAPLTSGSCKPVPTLNTYRAGADDRGHFGRFGGRFYRFPVGRALRVLPPRGRFVLDEPLTDDLLLLFIGQDDTTQRQVAAIELATWQQRWAVRARTELFSVL